MAEGPTLSLAARARAAAELVAARATGAPRVALILGSGLGELADQVEQPIRVPYAEIPHFPRSTVAGHAGELVLGRLEGVPVVAMRGRVHLYEGYSSEQVAFPVRVLRRLGADVLVVTNAAGGVDERFTAGDLMLIADHINLPGLAGENPLRGPADPDLPPRFQDLLGAYDPALRALAHEVAGAAGFALQEGVYAMVGGPSYETLAELRFLRHAGASVVGMSTVPEVIVARHEGMRVLGISAVTNTAVGEHATQETSHEDVLAAAERIKPRLLALVRGVLAALR